MAPCLGGNPRGPGVGLFWGLTLRGTRGLPWAPRKGPPPSKGRGARGGPGGKPRGNPRELNPG